MSSDSSVSLPHAFCSPVGELAWDAESVQLLVRSAGGNLLQWNHAARHGVVIARREMETLLGLPGGGIV